MTFNQMQKGLALILATILFSGCGVKGKPLPPLQTPPIGGDPEKSNDLQKKK